jgi:hypothetical protein
MTLEALIGFGSGAVVGNGDMGRGMAWVEDEEG